MSNVTTNLEAIAQQIEQEKQKKLNDILNISGSAAMVKNDYNVTVVDDTNVASSLIFKSLTKEKYDNTELIKAVDVNVKELAPNIPTPTLNLVPKPLYDTEVSTSLDLRNQVDRLNLTINNLNSQILDLQTQVQAEINKELSIEQTNDVVVNQLTTVGNSVNQFATQIATSLQKSVDESILRASLQAQNTGFKSQIQALIKQIDSLNSIIEGLQAQLGAVQQQQAIQQGTQAQAMAAGADVINEVCIVKIDKSNQTDNPFFGKINGSGGNKWINGKSVNFTNNDKSPIKVSIQISATQDMNWFYPSESNFTLEAGAQKDITMNINEGAAGNVDSKSGKWGYSHSASYKGGSVKISVTRNDNSVKDKTYDASFDKMFPGSY